MVGRGKEGEKREGGRGGGREGELCMCAKVGKLAHLVNENAGKPTQSTGMEDTVWKVANAAIGYSH